MKREVQANNASARQSKLGLASTLLGLFSLLMSLMFVVQLRRLRDPRVRFGMNIHMYLLMAADGLRMLSAVGGVVTGLIGVFQGRKRKQALVTVGIISSILAGLVIVFR